MDETEKLLAERDVLLGDMNSIVAAAEAANRELTDDEQRRFDRSERAVKITNGKLAKATLAAPQPTIAAHRQQRHAGRFAAPASREFESLAEFVHAATFRKDDSRLVFHEFERAAATDQSMSVGSRGGFAVPTQFLPALRSVDPAVANIRPRATVLPAGSPPDAAITLPALDQSGTSGPSNMFGGVELNWGVEAGTMQQTDALLREVTLVPHEISGFLKISNKLLRNWQAATPAIDKLFRGAIMSAEERAFIQGSGAGQPHGIVNAEASYVVNRGASNTFTLPDLDNMTARLLMRGGSPVWIISQSVMPKLRGMRNYSSDSPALGDGALVWNPDRRDENGRQMLNGYPILWSERSPTLGSKGDVILADLSAYLIKDGSGPFIDASEHLFFATNQTAIRIVWNVDGMSWLSSTINLEDDYDVSPFVVLDVPA